MKPQHPFFDIGTHGFVRIAACIPNLRVADPAWNTAATLELAKEAASSGAALAVFPELGLSAYSNDDLFHQRALLDAVRTSLQTCVEASRTLAMVLVVGAPLCFHGKLFNCAVVIHGGRIHGIVPKSYLPNYHEFYEKRQFCSAADSIQTSVLFAGVEIPFGADLLFTASGRDDFVFHVEICEDLWTPIPPSTYAALGGATVLCNLSASNITIGKADYRRDLCAAQSGRCLAAYLYTAAGHGESTTDLAWDGHALIYESDQCLGESRRFSSSPQCLLADIDLDRLIQDRMRMTSFHDSATRHRSALQGLRRIVIEHTPAPVRDALRRPLERFPYVPSVRGEREQRCYEAYNIQVHGLMKRMQAARIEHLVIGVSGGLDSTQALIVAARTMDRMGLPRTNILAYTMPGFATSSETLANALKLMDALAVERNELDIRPACMQMLKDLNHPFARGEEVYDITFENVQAGQRTAHLFRIANHRSALVLGTGDLSELALGWCTYGVGDHMSHYNVNCSVPKTLIQHLIRWVIESAQFDSETGRILDAVLHTEISPELVPAASPRLASQPESASASASKRPAQHTESVIGPYELQDFNLYYLTRYGFRPSKVAFLSWQAWRDRNAHDWPAGLDGDARHQYDLTTIYRWLRSFLWRFFQTSQFKRSCVPNGPKVGSGGSLSPRGDWRAPSDSEAQCWLDELEANVPHESDGANTAP